MVVERVKEPIQYKEALPSMPSPPFMCQQSLLQRRLGAPLGGGEG